MNVRITFLFRNFLFWIGFGLIFRFVFLSYHFKFSTQIPYPLLPELILHGLHMDLSVASYLSCVPLILVLLANVLPGRLIGAGIFFHAFFFMIVLTVISTADLEIFHTWGCHMDATALRYLTSPKEAFASSYSSPLFLLMGIFTTGVVLFNWIYVKHIQAPFKNMPSIGLWNIPLGITASALMLVAARGGIQQIPLNASFACFSNNDFANQAAVNEHWIFFSSLYKRAYNTENPYQYFSLADARKIAANVYSQNKKNQFPKIVKTNTPNVVLIIWESLTGTAVEAVGGTPGITPGFNRLAREGLLFSRIYSTGDRTSKGLTGVISGYPAQPKSPIIESTKKASQLPTLSSSLKKRGYHTSFYYGGEIEFDNMKTYLSLGGFDRIIDRKTFNSELSKSKWGAHDHTVFEKALVDLKKEHQPFFSVILTLSSHEPFEVPMKAKFPGTDIESKFKNSLFYTDQAVESFVEKLKNEPWYKDTLIVIVADHGAPILGNIQRFKPEKFHIPMLFLGGALKTAGSVISRIGSQQDLARTLLEQLDVNANDFCFSRNLLSDSSDQFAEFFYNDAFTLVNERGYVAFENISQRFLYRDPQITNDDVRLGQAIMQTSYQDYLDKGEPGKNW